MERQDLLTLGSLFDGIGVFPLAASRFEIVPMWASEIEKSSVSITKRHFPGMIHLGDITKLDGGKIPPVHVLTFGSPCQNLSSVGIRDGLAGEKSSLFYQAIRIMREMRRATDGIYPVIAVWENVMGAFSSNDRMDFRAVLESIAAVKIPMPPAGRWANAGMVRGGTPDIVWRVLDSQYWGRPRLPQRRKRIFVVADFGGGRAGEILFKPRDMLPSLAPCGDCGMPAARGNRIPFDEAGGPLPIVRPIQGRRMRGTAKCKDKAGFISSFGHPDDPFPTLLAGTVNMFSLWYGDDYKNGILRHLTPTECERLMGLPDGWTFCGHDGKEISAGVRCRALGNAIALPCAEYIMSGVADILKRGKESCAT